MSVNRWTVVVINNNKKLNNLAVVKSVDWAGWGACPLIVGCRMSNVEWWPPSPRADNILNNIKNPLIK